MILISTQCFPPVLGGVETLMAGLAHAIHASGGDVVVFADGPDNGDDARRAYAVKRFGGLKPVRRRLKARAVRAAAKDADLLICDSWKSLELLPPPPEGLRVHCLIHGMEVPREARAAKTERIRAAFGKATRLLANSRFTAELAYPFLPENADLWIATPPIAAQPDAPATALSELDAQLGRARPLIAFVGRLEPRKGVDRVIDALAELRVWHPSAMFAVAGSGPDRARLEALARERDLSEKVRFLGRVTDAQKAALLTRADIFAMPTRRDGASVEGFGIVYLEAGWHGTPSLAGRGSGAEDAVIDGRTGLLCDGEDPVSVRETLARLLASPAERAQLGAAARARARSQIWRDRLPDFL